MLSPEPLENAWTIVSDLGPPSLQRPPLREEVAARLKNADESFRGPIEAALETLIAKEAVILDADGRITGVDFDAKADLADSQAFEDNLTAVFRAVQRVVERSSLKYAYLSQIVNRFQTSGRYKDFEASLDVLILRGRLVMEGKKITTRQFRHKLKAAYGRNVDNLPQRALHRLGSSPRGKLWRSTLFAGLFLSDDEVDVVLADLLQDGFIGFGGKQGKLICLTDAGRKAVKSCT